MKPSCQGSGQWMIECGSNVRHLDPPTSEPALNGAMPTGKWELLNAPGSGIPFITDGVVKKWAIAVFQESNSSNKMESVDDGPPELDLDKIPSGSSTTTQVPPPSMPGLPGLTDDL